MTCQQINNRRKSQKKKQKTEEGYNWHAEEPIPLRVLTIYPPIVPIVLIYNSAELNAFVYI